jgi:hypothetical protein
VGAQEKCPRRSFVGRDYLTLTRCTLRGLAGDRTLQRLMGGVVAHHAARAGASRRAAYVVTLTREMLASMGDGVLSGQQKRTARFG